MGQHPRPRQVNGVVVIYTEPPEARKPTARWRLYPFKEGEALPPLHISAASMYLIGKESKVCTMPMYHPSISKQHAALQYRLRREQDAATLQYANSTVPYIIDLSSTNGTFLNGDKVEAQRYYELKEKDVLKFGLSSREYVLMRDKGD